MRLHDAETISLDEGAEPAVPAGPSGSRYTDLGRLGRGGTAEVRRVRDHQLDRVVAMKILRPELAERPGPVSRFLAEARTTARLQHPGIVPVYDQGRLPDGRPYFTMREVAGETLEQVARKWPFRRLITVFHQACAAVAYAHHRGIVHRDLKPGNLMIGDFGELLVVDWGLAVATGTVATHVAGTPAYLAPELAQVGVAVAPRADVYGLGAILYELLCGRPPYRGRSAAVLDALRAGPPDPVDAGPDELAALCRAAMDRDPGARPADAGALADGVAAWLDGLRRRELALARVAVADRAVPEAEALRADAARLRTRAAEALATVPVWADEQHKAAAWTLQDEAAGLEREARRREIAAGEELAVALSHDPELPEAHARLLERALAAHRGAEAARDADRLEEARISLEMHRRALPAAHPSRVRATRWLTGDGALSLSTEVPCHVELLRYERHNRRLVAVPFRDLGTTPLRSVPLPMGSFLAVLRAEGRRPVRYPVAIGREEHWDAELAVPIPASLGQDDVYVPPGWFRAGGDPETPSSLPARRLWCEGFVIRRYPVRNRDYLAFLDRLVAAGRAEEALALAPRERGSGFEAGALLYGFDGRNFRLVPDEDGDLWDPDWPVMMVDFAGAVACAREAGWRLASEFEWEKAARGVDGRFYPWGDFLDPSWCAIRDSHPDQRLLPARMQDFPVDESPYGVRHLAGNVFEFCGERWNPAPELPGDRVVPTPLPDRIEPTERRAWRGGTWLSNGRNSRCAARDSGQASYRDGLVGFRLARSLLPEETCG